MHDDELDPVHSSDNPDTDNSRRLYVKKMNLVSGTGAVQELSPAYYEGLMRQIEKGDSVSLDHRVVEVTLVDIQGNEHHLANPRVLFDYCIGANNVLEKLPSLPSLLCAIRRLSFRADLSDHPAFDRLRMCVIKQMHSDGVANERTCRVTVHRHFLDWQSSQYLLSK